MALAVETHPQRDLIIKAMLAGDSLKQLSQRLTPKLSHVALFNYRNAKIKPAMRNLPALEEVLAVERVALDPIKARANAVALTAARLDAEPILSRIGKHQHDHDLVAAAAVEAKDGRSLAALINADLKGLELTARLSGLLDGPQQSAGTVNNFYIAVAAPPMPAAGPVIDVEPSK